MSSVSTHDQQGFGAGSRIRAPAQELGSGITLIDKQDTGVTVSYLLL